MTTENMMRLSSHRAWLPTRGRAHPRLRRGPCFLLGAA